MGKQGWKLQSMDVKDREKQGYRCQNCIWKGADFEELTELWVKLSEKFIDIRLIWVGSKVLSENTKP